MNILKKRIMLHCVSKVHHALKGGLLTKSPCYFCNSNKRLHAHHIDYRHPLEVVWMCHSCHLKYHSKLKRIRRAFGIPTYEGQYLLLAKNMELKDDLLEEKESTFFQLKSALRENKRISGILLPLETALKTA